MKVGIISYGGYIPSGRITSSEIDTVRGLEPGSTAAGSGLVSKAVPASDEDTITLATMAAGQAVARAQLHAGWSVSEIGSLFIGSESHPYAVKPSGATVAAALGLPKTLALADLEFACKAGTQALQIAAAYTRAGMHSCGLAVGSDTAQAAPGDALEYTAAAGAAAYLVGSGSERVVAELLETASIATDTPDFWRAAGAAYPSHAGRFTGEPAYFAHISAAVSELFTQADCSVADIDYCVFHTPNVKFPQEIAKRLGFSKEQLAPSLLVSTVGNTYSAASLLAFAHLLDQVPANKTILVASYGSGAGSDAFLFRTTALLERARLQWSTFLADQIATTHDLSYTQYLRNTARSH